MSFQKTIREGMRLAETVGTHREAFLQSVAHEATTVGELETDRLVAVARYTLKYNHVSDVCELARALNNVLNSLQCWINTGLYRPIDPKKWINEHPYVMYLTHKLRNASCVAIEDRDFRRIENAVKDMARTE